MDFLEMFTDNWLGRIILVICLLLVAGLIFSIWYPLTHKCLVSHEEIQYQAPLGVVVGGSKYGGGVSVPLGNIRPIKVIVCDEYAE